MSTCPHGKPIGVDCYVCKAEAVRAAVRSLPMGRVMLGEFELTPEQERDAATYVDYIAKMQKPRDRVSFRKVPHPRAVATVALMRIVDRAVSDELYSPATADILRIALKALNTLEE